MNDAAISGKFIEKKTFHVKFEISLKWIINEAALSDKMLPAIKIIFSMLRRKIFMPFNMEKKDSSKNVLWNLINKIVIKIVNWNVKKFFISKIFVEI